MTTLDSEIPSTRHGFDLPPGTDVAAVRKRARSVLRLLIEHRRTPVDHGESRGLGAGTADPGGSGEFPQATRTADPGADPDDWPYQLRTLMRQIAADVPITLTLPGFPCKSPHPDKVCGTLPDEGERRALRFLDGLCARIAEIHEPGAELVICSDGHVFTDVIGVADDTICEYNDELRCIIDAEHAHLQAFDLRDVWGPGAFEAKRERLVAEWAPTVDSLREEARADGEAARLVRGMTRFMVADTVGWTGTSSALQRDAKRRAYELLRRSRAWGAVVAGEFPEAVRLSIHPQPPGSAKFGIALLRTETPWTTPWHSVLVVDGDQEARSDADDTGKSGVGEDGATGFPRTDGRLLPHAAARAFADPVVVDGRISHYVMRG